MSLAEENRKDIVAYRIERAYTALEQAKLNFKLNCLEVKYTVGTDPTVYIVLGPYYQYRHWDFGMVTTRIRADIDAHTGQIIVIGNEGYYRL